MKTYKVDYLPTDVAFGWNKRARRGSWNYCSEVFEGDFDYINSKKIFFFFPYNTPAKDTIAFLEKLEQKLGIKSSIKEVELKSDLSGRSRRAVRVKPDKFWKQHTIRFSFLTAILKTFAKKENALAKLEKKDFIDFFKKAKYFKRNKYALRLFLGGFTKIDSKYLARSYDDWIDEETYGETWKDTFDHLSKKITRKILLAA